MKKEKELKELLEEIIDKMSEDTPKEEAIKDTKKVINEVLEKKPSSLIFTTPYGSIQYGKESEVLTCLACTINSIKEVVSNDKFLVYAMMAGLTDKDNPTLDSDLTSTILEVLKQFQ